MSSSVNLYIIVVDCSSTTTSASRLLDAHAIIDPGCAGPLTLNLLGPLQLLPDHHRLTSSSLLHFTPLWVCAPCTCSTPHLFSHRSARMARTPACLRAGHLALSHMFAQPLLRSLQSTTVAISCSAFSSCKRYARPRVLILTLHACATARIRTHTRSTHPARHNEPA